MSEKYSMYNLMREFRENKPLIEAYLKRQSAEGFKNGDAKAAGTILGMSVAMFLIFFIIALGVLIWAIVVLVKYWKVLPTWAQVVGLISLISGFIGLPIGGPIITLIMVYVAKAQGGSKYSRYNFRSRY